MSYLRVYILWKNNLLIAIIVKKSWTMTPSFSGYLQPLIKNFGKKTSIVELSFSDPSISWIKYSNKPKIQSNLLISSPIKIQCILFLQPSIFIRDIPDFIPPSRPQRRRITPKLTIEQRRIPPPFMLNPLFDSKISYCIYLYLPLTI